ncbi:MAG: RNA-splicing ligase RtcB [Betaproteobacteria bacterium]|nr:RNA-splicing ligase RtcB [Betaproteobacteria bacterium]
MPVRQVIDEGRVPVRIYTDEVEAQARQQLVNLSQLPIVFHHVAAMPDVHTGIGSTVGAVIATHRAIIPAAVGVDIGCFTGDTKIPLLDGTQTTLKELSERGGEHWVFVIGNDRRITGAKATARLTRRDAPLMLVELDNAERIYCTPDHQFLLRDGSWCEAGQLRVGASLMPLYRRINAEGYTEVLQPGTHGYQRFHWALARSGALGPIPVFPGQKTVIHHKDFNESNNDPANLQFMGDRDHSAYHRSLVERNTHWQSEDFEGRRVAALGRKAKTPEGREYFATRGTKNITRYMAENREAFLRAVSGNGKRGKKWLIAYNKSGKGRAKSRENVRRLLQVERICPHCGEKFMGHLRLNAHKRHMHGYNHRVKRIQRLDRREDVYCLTVPGYENFALSAGVFVHNCGMIATRTSLTANDLDETRLKRVFDQISRDVPVGRDQHKEGRALTDAAKPFGRKLDVILKKHPQLEKRFPRTRNWVYQMGTLGGGNHFIEVCLDEAGRLWVMLHSGSRGIGNAIGTYFIELARRDAERHQLILPDRDLAYLEEGAGHFDDYVEAVGWAQAYAAANRHAMMDLVLSALRRHMPPFEVTSEAVNCHHNYVEREHHYGKDVWLTRKGAIRARAGDLGIIPGSMGAKSYIVRGKGSEESFQSCAHGAGRRMSRTQANKAYTPRDLVEQTQGVVCRKDKGVIDEIPAAYKNIDEVMENQTDLVEVVHTLKQVICVKG